MTYYDFIKQNESIIDQLMSIGVVPVTIISHLEYFAFFRSRLQVVSRWRAIQDTAIEYNVSDMTVSRVVNKLNQQLTRIK